ncbi:antibiotic biosynthesis monooxygenase family protein [Marinicellulosiphila megalodicopiae]|uniref:antibiotic biosynthesis monooxygenase family protein n=1 Tax=Marinicellulosiphila megalodicopiae TaxID=2724896 RepID=UPI003BB0BABB
MIKVMIERKIQFGEEQAYDLAAQKMLSAVLLCKGYISSEQLFVRGKANHRVIITTWQSTHDWEAWASSAERNVAISFFEPLLIEQERVLVLKY